MYFSLNKSIILKSVHWSTSIFKSCYHKIVIFSSDLDICLTFYFMISINNNNIKLKNSNIPYDIDINFKSLLETKLSGSIWRWAIFDYVACM